MKYYKLDLNTLESELGTDLRNGLSTEQADERFDECGYNVQANQLHSHTLKFTFTKTFVFVIIASIIYYIAAIFKHSFDYVYFGVSITVISVLSSLMFFGYLHLVNKKIRKSMIIDYGTLIAVRNGKDVELKYNEVMYGDIVTLKKGDYIPFDGRIIECSNFIVDESQVTSQSAVEKRTGIIKDDNIPASKLFNTVFCGSYVIKGTAKIAVTDIGKRVYISKIRKNSRVADKYAPGITAFTNILAIALTALALLFTFITSFVSSDFISLYVLIALWVALFLTDFFSKFISLAFTLPYIDLHNESIYLKTPSVLESLNGINTLLINQNIMFDDKTEISGFVTESGEYRPISEINKSNFGVFLYSAFSYKINKELPVPAFLNANIKVLKKIGVDYKDVESICPVINNYCDITSGYEMCARIHDGNNMIIAHGNINKIFSMCNDVSVDSETLNRLNDSSTYVTAIAIKKVDIVPSELADENTGFTFAGLIGVNRKISSTRIKFCSELRCHGVHSIILFSGSKRAVQGIFGNENVNCLNCSDLDKVEISELAKCDVICDFDGDIERVVDICRNNKLRIAYSGDKMYSDKKTVTFKTPNSSHYDNIDADVVSDGQFESIYKAFCASDRCAYAINKIIEHTFCFSTFYIVIGVLFSVFYESLLFNPLSLLLIMFIVFPITSVMLLHLKRDMFEFKNRNSFVEPIAVNNLLSIVVFTLLMIILAVILRFIVQVNTATGLVMIVFMAFLPRGYICKISFTPKRLCYVLISFAPALLSSIIFMTPLSFLFGVTGFGLFEMLIAMIVGITLRIITHYISVSSSVSSMNK